MKILHLGEQFVRLAPFPAHARVVPTKFFMSSGIPCLVGFNEDYDSRICLVTDKIVNAVKSKKFLLPTR